MYKTNTLKIKREHCTYTPCYCEENVWKLCEKIKDSDSDLLENCYVIFVSNDAKQVPIWFQRSGHISRDNLCIWDYHVFLILKDPKETKVYDFDTVLEFPVTFNNYVKQAIKPEYNEHYERLFRVISADIFLSTFASDRSHMRKPDGSYTSDPPFYAPISSKDSTNNIQEFISMNSKIGYGEVMNLKKFCQYFLPNQLD
ncbi:N-terminal glutamine amidase tungus [Rhodnius prolixus]|uniref:Protein N-terminal glutamine amidohydrolase n=2 Tax=Rhodnius TaxID=13248 RepID=R4FJL9_RHOPR